MDNHFTICFKSFSCSSEQNDILDSPCPILKYASDEINPARDSAVRSTFWWKLKNKRKTTVRLVCPRNVAHSGAIRTPAKRPARVTWRSCPRCCRRAPSAATSAAASTTASGPARAARCVSSICSSHPTGHWLRTQWPRVSFAVALLDERKKKER